MIKIEEDEISFSQMEDKFLESSNACSKEVKLEVDSKENVQGMKKQSCTKDLNKLSVSKIARKPFKI